MMNDVINDLDVVGVGGKHAFITSVIKNMKLKPYFAQLKVKRIGGPYEILRFEKKEGEEIAVSELHTDGGIAAALAARRINKLFPIQRFLMECVKSGRNILARSRAGTGKTIAFEIPILEKISWRKRQKWMKRNLLALILEPSTQLARQVEEEFRTFAPCCSNSLCCR